MKAHFEMMAAYNAWANRRLYAAAGEMTETELKAPAGAFFGSLFGTLSHILLGDRAWMRRFEGTGPAVTSLTEQPFGAFAELSEARVAMDERIARYVAGLRDEDVAAEMSFTAMTLPGPATVQRGEALSHLFNHQTHHRGQCHHMLTAAGREAPPLDILNFRLAA